MKRDLDLILYNKYLNGDKKAFETLYNKYKNKIQYFIFNIVNDYQKAEDITQETFMYILQNNPRDNYSFKYYIYLIAKSRAYNYINVEKRRSEIDEKYSLKRSDEIQKSIEDILITEETKNELLKLISMLDTKYKNALYLVKIEELSYQEAASILGETLSNTKVLIHRGKNELRKILIKRGFDNMNKLLKIFILILCTTIALSGIVYAITNFFKSYNNSNLLTPVFTSDLSNIDENKIWVGTFNLTWNDLMDKVGGKIEFETGNSNLVNELNEQTFTTSRDIRNFLL